MTQNIYDDRLPKQCPPVEAERVNSTLYKAIDGDQPVIRDFHSFAERGRKNTDPQKCISWGLSVWPDMNAVMHGRDAIPYFRTKKIIQFSITPEDGCVGYTPSATQPDHHTFWKVFGRNLLNECEIVLEEEV